MRRDQERIAIRVLVTGSLPESTNEKFQPELKVQEVAGNEEEKSTRSVLNKQDQERYSNISSAETVMKVKEVDTVNNINNPCTTNVSQVSTFIEMH